MIRQTTTDLNAMIATLDKTRLKVGFFEHSRYPDGTPIAGIAYIQENGSVKNNIPSRPFFDPAMQDGKVNYANGIAKAVREMIRGGDLEQGLTTVGEVAAGDIREKITELDSPELSPRTIEARARRHHAGLASSKPLVDTGQMLQAVAYAVETE